VRCFFALVPPSHHFNRSCDQKNRLVIRSHSPFHSDVKFFDDLRVLSPPLPWHRAEIRAAPGDRIVFLHGLWRSYLAMDGVAQEFYSEGYETVNLSYPSFTKPMEEIVARVHHELKSLPQKKTHFVTHSLGGIVVRHLARHHPELVSGRVVMVAPPSQGSEIIDWLEECPLTRIAFGPAGLSLSTTRVMAEVPQLSDTVEVGVIMGHSKKLPFFQEFLESENDGIVSVEKGRLPKMQDFTVVEGDHTFIMNEPLVRKLAKRFLQLGHFREKLRT